MKNFIKVALLVLFVVISTGSFSSEQNPLKTQVVEAVADGNFGGWGGFGGGNATEGCTDIFATNYDIFADVDDGSCMYPEPEITSCDLTSSATTVENGGSVTLTWATEGFENFTINGQPVSGKSGNKTFSNITINTTYTLVATNSNNDRCQATVNVQCLPPVVRECELDINKTVNKSTARVGDEVTYTITVRNNGDADCTGGGVKIFDVVDGNLIYKSHTLTSNLTAGYGNQPVYSSSDRTLRFNGNTLSPNESGTITWVGKVANPNQCGDFVVKNQAKVTAKELNNFQTWVYSQNVRTDIDNDCVTPLPQCDSFTASPSNILVGEKTTLQWNTTNAVQVFLNNGIGAVSVDGTYEVSPTVNTTYVLTVIGAKDKTVDCSVPVRVSQDEVPVCKSFTASPSALPVGGGNVNLNWEVTGASNVSIAPTVGSVGLTGNRTLNVTQATTYVLTATDSNGDQTQCSAPVTVADPGVFTCADNVNFTISDSSIDRGDSVTLTWSTNDVDSLTISNLNTTALSGSQTVSPSNDITYILRATQGNRTVNCPVSVNVSSGGGGGGTPTPRCDLDISDKKITKGEEITLRWDTSNAREITIEDDRGNVIFTTEDYLSSDKRDYYDGSIKVKPTRDTEYTLIAERGSKDRECEVEVEVEDDNVVVLQSRDQQPLVAGISLTQEPYTGFEAGPFMTTLFYALLVLWSLFITYLLVIRNRVVPAGIKTFMPSSDTSSNKDSMKQAEAARPDVFAPSVMSKMSATQTTPSNLPTGISDTAQDEVNSSAATAQPHQASDSDVTEIENRAHTQKALLSSDAVRHFIASTEGSLERDEVLDQVIAEAKKSYPLEDGWIVINQARMQSVCEVCGVVTKNDTPATVPAGTGSLAEAIVTGNVVAAYEMIGHRPMIALADAAADLDAVYRNRKDENNTVSDMLSKETQNLSDEQITQMITALTGALDGTYTDEASAVKMAIMKAVKIAA